MLVLLLFTSHRHRLSWQIFCCSSPDLELCHRLWNETFCFGAFSRSPLYKILSPVVNPKILQLTIFLGVPTAPTGDIAQLSIGDEQPVEVKTTISGSYTMTANRGKGYSPSNGR